MTRTLKFLLTALIAMVLLANLLELCVACLPTSTPPASAQEIRDLTQPSPRHTNELANAGGGIR